MPGFSLLLRLTSLCHAIRFCFHAISPVTPPLPSGALRSAFAIDAISAPHCCCRFSAASSRFSSISQPDNTPRRLHIASPPLILFLPPTLPPSPSRSFSLLLMPPLFPDARFFAHIIPSAHLHKMRSSSARSACARAAQRCLMVQCASSAARRDAVSFRTAHFPAAAPAASEETWRCPMPRSVPWRIENVRDSSSRARCAYECFLRARQRRDAPRDIIMTPEPPFCAAALPMFAPAATLLVACFMRAVAQDHVKFAARARQQHSGKVVRKMAA